MSDESCLSFTEESDIAKKNGNPTGSDESYANSSPDQDSNFGKNYQNQRILGKIRGRRGKAKRVLNLEESDKKRLLANSQERDRMDRLNNALEHLRDHLPSENMLHHRKLSKIRTLTVATNYIEALSRMIDEHDSSLECQPETPSCLYAPRDHNSYYRILDNQSSSYQEPRISEYNNYASLREQRGAASSLFSPYEYTEIVRRVSPELSGIHQYPSPGQGVFLHTLTNDDMACPISEISPFNYCTSTPLSSRTHPYSRR